MFSTVQHRAVRCGTVSPHRRIVGGGVTCWACVIAFGLLCIRVSALDLIGALKMTTVRFSRDLVKLGRYARGLDKLYDAVHRYFWGFTKIGGVTFELIHHSEEITLSKSPFDACRHYWESRYRSKYPLNETEFKRKLGYSQHIAWPKVLTISRHAGIGLILRLSEMGISRGPIGVSKDCCVVCAAMIRSLISFGQCWTVPGDRGRADLSLLSGIQAADMNAHNVVTQTLDRILKYYVPSGSQSLRGSPDSSETDSTLGGVKFQWLNNTSGLA